MATRTRAKAVATHVAGSFTIPRLSQLRSSTLHRPFRTAPCRSCNRQAIRPEIPRFSAWAAERQARNPPT
eukprot:749300-Hanusia_phi.AAC.9